ncbi:MAG TPA: MFS transporter [Candidatus Acidoferrales bacterium]|nr:MFS transporter [Candidatus Acidoferrales bacterium]
MTDRERQGWIIVASLFVTLLLIFGSGYNTGSVFIPPLIKYFGWSRTKVSSLQSLLAVSAGLSGPLIGWLLDRVEARLVIVAGAATSAAAWLLASQANTFSVLLTAYLMMGVGLSAATLLPASLVVANWFGAKRGLAMGMTFAGTSFGGAVMAIVASHAISWGGSWRVGYVTLAIPMVVVAIPLVLLVIKTRPDDAPGETISVSERADALPGFELSEAMRTRSFWMLCAAQFLYATMAAGVGLHFIPYLIGLGYRETFAAGMLSVVFLFTTMGKLGMGFAADRVSARIALAVNFIGAAIGMLLIFGARDHLLLYPFVAIYGLTLGAPLVLIPLLTADSLGLKRFGAIGGVAGIFNTAGAFIGPMMLGRIFDVSGSYSSAFVICIVLCGFGMVATLACLPFESEQARTRLRLARAATAA